MPHALNVLNFECPKHFCCKIRNILTFQNFYLDAAISKLEAFGFVVLYAVYLFVVIESMYAFIHMCVYIYTSFTPCVCVYIVYAEYRLVRMCCLIRMCSLTSMCSLTRMCSLYAEYRFVFIQGMYVHV